VEVHTNSHKKGKESEKTVRTHKCPIFNAQYNKLAIHERKAETA